MSPCMGDVHHHWWNEAGQMVAMVEAKRTRGQRFEANRKHQRDMAMVEAKRTRGQRLALSSRWIFLMV